MSMAQAQKLANRGGALLDDLGPAGWRGLVRLDRLDMLSCCVLDHVYGAGERWGEGFSTGLRALGLAAPSSAAGFGFAPCAGATQAELEAAWAVVVRGGG